MRITTPQTIPAIWDGGNLAETLAGVAGTVSAVVVVVIAVEEGSFEVDVARDGIWTKGFRVLNEEIVVGSSQFCTLIKKRNL